MAQFILLHGPPGAGKTTLARELASKFGLPIISKDNIKVTLADSISGEGLEWSRSLGAAAFRLMKLLLTELSRSNSTYLIDAAFLTNVDSDFVESLNSAGSTLTQIYCNVDAKTARNRIVKRLESGERHHCHQDHLRTHDIEETIRAGTYASFGELPTIHYDSNNAEELRFVFSEIEKLVGGIEGHL